MARSALNPTLGQFVSLVGPSSPVKPMVAWEQDEGPLASYLQTKRPTEKQLLDEIKFASEVPEIPSEDLQKSSFLSSPDVPSKVVVEADSSSKPLSSKDRADIAKGISSGLLEAGKSLMELENKKRELKLQSQLEEQKSKAQASQFGAESNVGALRSYVANLRAAMGR